MNFRSGINLVLLGLRSGFNNTRSKSNGSPLKNFSKTESGFKNFRRRPIDIRIKFSDFKTDKINIRVGIGNLKSSLNNCTSKVSHKLQTGLKSAGSELNNVLSNVKIVRPEIDNLKAEFQSTMNTTRAKLRNSLGSGLEKTRSGMDNVRNSFDSGLEKTQSGLNNVRSQLSNTRLHFDEIWLKLNNKRNKLQNSFQSGIRNTRSKTYSFPVESVKPIVLSEIKNTRKGQYFLRIGYKIIQWELKSRSRSERRNRTGIRSESKEYRSRSRSERRNRTGIRSESKEYRSRSEENFQNRYRSTDSGNFRTQSKENRQYRNRSEENRRNRFRYEENFQNRYRSTDNGNFRSQSKENRQYRNRSEENRRNRSRSEENDQDWFQSSCNCNCCNCKSRRNDIEYYILFFLRIILNVLLMSSYM